MNKLQWNFNQNTKSVIHENTFEIIVCEMAAILSRGDELNQFAADTLPATGVSFLS